MRPSGSARANARSNVSLKLTQMGLDLGEDFFDLLAGVALFFEPTDESGLLGMVGWHEGDSQCDGR